mmetsp:Transcript_13227/g.29400  ORF Transcript_13227/g.29400 Transcript_13227/m.29400 type:complete len:252 (-) Transcript_13227:338-1093(-)
MGRRGEIGGGHCGLGGTLLEELTGMVKDRLILVPWGRGPGQEHAEDPSKSVSQCNDTVSLSWLHVKADPRCIRQSQANQRTHGGACYLALSAEKNHCNRRHPSHVPNRIRGLDLGQLHEPDPLLLLRLPRHHRGPVRHGVQIPHGGEPLAPGLAARQAGEQSGGQNGGEDGVLPLISICPFLHHHCQHFLLPQLHFQLPHLIRDLPQGAIAEGILSAKLLLVVNFAELLHCPKHGVAVGLMWRGKLSLHLS